MEYFQLTKTETGIHVEDIPDAVKLIRLEDPISRRLADLSLHKADLEFADRCLIEINAFPPKPEVVPTALWRCSIIHYMKCFGKSKARTTQLNAQRIYRSEPPVALEVHQYFRDLRNKHVVHDENAYSQSTPCAALNRGDKLYKVEKVVCITTRVDVLNQESYSNLKLLVDKSLTWVVSEFNACCSVITRELEKKSHEELIDTVEVTISLPTIEDVGKNRRRKM